MAVSGPVPEQAVACSSSLAQVPRHRVQRAGLSICLVSKFAQFNFSGPVAATTISMNNVNETLGVAVRNADAQRPQNVANGNVQLAGGTLADRFVVSIGSGT